MTSLNSKQNETSKIYTNGEHHETQEPVSKLQEENGRLTSQLKEVIRMNTHWQRYDAQREEHVLKLTKTIQELQDRVGNLQHRVQECTANQEFATSKANDLLKQIRTSDDRPGELKGVESNQEVAALTKQINELRKRNKELEREKESKREGNASNDELAILREQINVCVEDFKQERRDRERIHAENERLRERLAQAEARVMANEEQVFIYQEQIKRLQERVNTYSTPRPYNDQPCCYPEERPRRQLIAHSPSQNDYLPRRHHNGDFTELPRDVEIDGDLDGGVDEPDGQSNAADTTTVKVDSPLMGGKDEEALECPRCLASFAISRHADLLDHINKCME